MPVDVLPILLGGVSTVTNTIKAVAPEIIGVAVAVLALVLGWNLVRHFVSEGMDEVEPYFWEEAEYEDHLIDEYEREFD